MRKDFIIDFDEMNNSGIIKNMEDKTLSRLNDLENNLLSGMNIFATEILLI
jgi:hypothetical protein